MNGSRLPFLLALAATLVALTGCKPKAREITALQRKEADFLVAEAAAAMNLKDWARAESMLAKAVETVPDNGVCWTSLGATRLRLGNKAGAKEAYQGAFRAYETQLASNGDNVEAWLKQVYVLALLGRIDDARTMLDKVNKRFPNHRNVRAFVDGKQLDRMIADPTFQRNAL